MFKFNLNKFSLLAIMLAASVVPCKAMRKFVIAGGPCVGKSEVVKELEKNGYPCAPEAYTKMKEEYVSAGKGGEFFSGNFRERLMNYQLGLEAELVKQVGLQGEKNSNKICFLDRSTFDVYHMAEFFDSEHKKASEELLAMAKKGGYCKLVFFLEPLPEKDYVKTEARQCSREDALREHEFLKEKYQDEGYGLIYVPFDTPENRAKFIIEKAKEYISNWAKQRVLGLEIKDVIDCFAGLNTKYKIENFSAPVRLIQFSKDGKTYRFFGVHKDDQEKVDFKEFKHKVAELMGVCENGMFELVGDSNQFSDEGTVYARKFVGDRIGENSIMEYGFTGYIRPGQLDVNSIISEYANENPSKTNKILGNILSHSQSGILKEFFEGSLNITNFVVVYNDFGSTGDPVYDKETGKKLSGFTTFGEDVTMSDEILQSQDKDKFICLEGGAQSFRQVVNALKRSITVELVYNLRRKINEDTFSAAHFFNRVNEALKSNPNLNKEDVVGIYESYVKTLKNLWDPKRFDSKTKKELFEKAKSDFMEYEIYKKIGTLCKFYNAKEQAK